MVVVVVQQGCSDLVAGVSTYGERGGRDRVRYTIGNGWELGQQKVLKASCAGYLTNFLLNSDLQSLKDGKTNENV